MNDLTKILKNPKEVEIDMIQHIKNIEAFEKKIKKAKKINTKIYEVRLD